MLHPTISVKQDPLDTDRLFIVDTTAAYNLAASPYGYGDPHVTRSEVDYISLSLIDPSGKYWLTGPLNWKPTKPKLDIIAGDFKPAELANTAPDDDPCAWIAPRQCYRPGPLHFLDGFYEMTYEVYGKKGIPQQLKSYSLSLNLCKNEQVWVKRMGAWTNFTTLGTLSVRGEYRWSQQNTPVVYEDYQVRRPIAPNTYKIVERGMVEYVYTDAPELPLTTSDTPKLVGSTTIRFMLTGIVSKRIAKLAKRPFDSFNDLVSGCDSLSALAFTRQQLDTLIAGGVADETAPLLLSTIVSSVDALQLELV